MPLHPGILTLFLLPMKKNIGILTSGGDCQGLNAAIRGVGKAAQDEFGMSVTGFCDGFRGLVLNKTMELDNALLSGILTRGGTILGTSRDKPHKMPMGGKSLDMVDTIVETYEKNRLDALVCIGGGGTQKNALRLKNAGLNILTLPKTIDNDIFGTDVSFGFDTAVGIATEAIDRLHSTAMSHNRIIVVEIMGHRAGWLALAAGIAGGADVVLIPEIPYDVDKVTESIKERTSAGKQFSIIAVAEGAMSVEQAAYVTALADKKKTANTAEEKKAASQALKDFHADHVNSTLRLTRQLEETTGQESRLTILGHLQRGGSPSATDRVLATRLGTACARLINEGETGVLVAARGDGVEPMPLEAIAGKKKLVQLDHPWVSCARRVGTSFGD